MIRICKACEGTGEVEKSSFTTCSEPTFTNVVCEACSGHGAWCIECGHPMNPADKACANCKAVAAEPDEPATTWEVWIVGGKRPICSCTEESLADLVCRAMTGFWGQLQRYEVRKVTK